MTVEEKKKIANKIVLAIKKGMERSVAERNYLPANISDFDRSEIKQMVDNELNIQEQKPKRSTVSINNNYDNDYDIGR